MYFQYIHIQTRDDIAVTSASGSSATLTTVGGTFNLSSGDYFIVSGFTGTAANNGVKVATGTPTGTSVDYDDALGQTQVNESVGDTVTVKEQPFDTASAIVVDDNGGTDISGQVTQQNITFDFNYDGNVQGGRTASTDAPVVVVAQGLNDSEWVFAEFTITEATGLSFPVNAPDELTYSNP